MLDPDDTVVTLATAEALLRRQDRAVEACRLLSLDDNAHIRQGAAELRVTLAEIDPVLYPQEPA
ncbi:hypothetical protein [Kribbella sp. DT2]|uniref:hypothetical protein n=1 Tax=Kribbella sp. DT2 TaxID=3393427 RepID=UPI003CF54D39